MYAAKAEVVKIVVQVMEFVAIFKQNPVAALKELPHVALLLVSILTFPAIVFGLLFGGGSSAAVGAKKSKIAEEKEGEKEVRRCCGIYLFLPTHPGRH